MINLPRSFKELQKSLQAADPPELWPEGLKALWWDRLENWENAHNIAQEYHRNWAIGFMLISTVKKEINGMQDIGIKGPDAIFQSTPWMKNPRN